MLGLFFQTSPCSNLKRAMTRCALSGERNRLLLGAAVPETAKPADSMNQPTTPDVETLGTAGRADRGYQGTVMLVSHDRQFVDNTVTEC